MGKRFITFETEPKPSETDDEQEVAKPLFEKLVTCIQRRGADIVTPPTEWDAYGWYVDVVVDSRSLTCMMQRSDTWLLLLTDNRSFTDRLMRRDYTNELSSLAHLVADAVNQAFGVERPKVQTEAEFLAA
jgi:hypothetical protein